MKTAAEQLEDRARAEGEQRGQAKTLLKLLKRKFNEVPAVVESAIRSASAEQLDRWTEGVLSAERAEDVIRD